MISSAARREPTPTSSARVMGRMSSRTTIPPSTFSVRPRPMCFQFTGGLTWADYTYTRTGDLDTVNLTMTITGTDSSVIMPDMLKTDALGLTHPNLISVFEFWRRHDVGHRDAVCRSFINTRNRLRPGHSGLRWLQRHVRRLCGRRNARGRQRRRHLYLRPAGYGSGDDSRQRRRQRPTHLHGAGEPPTSPFSRTSSI